MGNSLLIEIGANIARMQKDMATAQQSVKGFSDSATRSLSTLKSAFGAFGLYLGGSQVLGAFKSMIDTASNLQEQTAKFNTVFKGQQGIAEQWASTLVDSYAMSTREAKQYLAAMQDLLVPMGMNADAAGKMSFEVVKLATDLGSFNNLPTEKVMLDMQSALVGNYETMKKYGVVLKETLVQEKALAMGLARTKDELTAGQKAQAAYQLIMEGSKNAIGDMERTSDSYANTMKRLKANWEDLSGSLGTIFLPIARDIVAVLADWLRAWNDLVGATEIGMNRMVRKTMQAQLEQAKNLEAQFLGASKGADWADKALSWIPGYITQEEAERGLAVQRARIATITASLERLRQEEEERRGMYDRGRGLSLPTEAGQTYRDPKQVAKENAEAIKQAKLDADLLDSQIEARRMGRVYTNYQKEKEIDDEALEERLKGYRKIAEEEEKIWNAQVKEYKKKTEEMSRAMQDFAENSKWTLSEVFFDAMGRDLKSFGDYWEAFWTRMKNSLARTFADMTVNWAMQGLPNILFGAGGGGGGGLLGGALGAIGGAVGGFAKDAISSAGSWIAKLFHEGGIVGMGGPQIPLKAGEILSILELGEAVMSKDQVKALQGAFGGSTQAVNAFLSGGTTRAGVLDLGVLGAFGGMPAGLASMAPGFNLDFGDVFGFTSKGGLKGTVTNALAVLGLSSPKGVVSSIVQALAEAIASPISLADQGNIATKGGYAQPWGADLAPNYGGWDAMSVSEAMGILAGMGAGSVGGSASGIGGGHGIGPGAGPYGGYATGGIVPRDQVAKVHKGEGVFTPEQMQHLSPTGGAITVTVPVYIDGKMVSETVYDGFYDASKRRQVTLHKRGVEGYTSTVGLDL